MHTPIPNGKDRSTPQRLVLKQPPSRWLMTKRQYEEAMKIYNDIQDRCCRMDAQLQSAFDGLFVDSLDALDLMRFFDDGGKFHDDAA